MLSSEGEGSLAPVHMPHIAIRQPQRFKANRHHPKGAHPPSASDAPYFEGKEGAYRKETDVVPSAQPLPLKDRR